MMKHHRIKRIIRELSGHCRAKVVVARRYSDRREAWLAMDNSGRLNEIGKYQVMQVRK